LDFCTPFEVFSGVRLNEDKRREEPSPFEVLLVAEKSGTISASGPMDPGPAFHALLIKYHPYAKR
jgi:hypothetical protein